jgi:hypothetical protein
MGASEWQLAGQAQPPFTGVMFPSLAQFEWGARRALLRAQDLGVGVDLLALQSGDLSQVAPTPGPDDLIGCSAVLEPLTEQPVQFTGDFQEQGQTWAYPLPLGCMEVGDTISINMMYEGPGALLTKLTFSVPKRTGDHALEGDNLSLEVIRGNLKVIDFFAVGYAQPNMGDDDGRWIELYPYNEEAGTATVRSLEPLQGEVELVDWESDEGEVISLRAGFQCDVTGAGR